MKYRIPPGCFAVCHGGTAYEITADRMIEAEDADARSLAVHGIVPDGQSGAGEAGTRRSFDLGRINQMTRDELAAVYRNSGILEPVPKHLATLRASVRRLTSQVNP